MLLCSMKNGQECLISTQRYGKQFIWIIAAIVIAIFVVIIDSRFYFFFSWFIYGILMLIAPPCTSVWH